MALMNGGNFLEPIFRTHVCIKTLDVIVVFITYWY